MSKYTVELRTLLIDPFMSEEIKKAMSTYPIYIPVNLANFSLIPTRDELNSKILNHFKYYEIGFETPGRFIDELKITLEEIMPKYYSLYKSCDILNGIEDPFGNVDMVETFEQEKSGSTDNTSTGTSKGDTTTENTSTANTSATTETTDTTGGRTIETDTPQSRINIADDIDSVTFASKATWNEQESSSSSTNTGTDTTTGNTSTTTNGESQSESNQTYEDILKHTLTRKGNQGINTYAHDLLELRALFTNIENQIFDDLADLFMLVY